MRRLLPAAAVAALLAPAAALADVQQVLLPGPTPYPTPSPPLVTGGAPPWATLTFKIHASTDQRVRTGVDESGRVVSVRALERLHLTGTGDYLIVVSAPVLDVRMGPGSESEPGQRRGQILWSGFSSKRRLLVSDAKLRPGPVRPYLPLRLEARREGDRYELAVTNATTTSQVAFQGTGCRRSWPRCSTARAATRWRTGDCGPPTSRSTGRSRSVRGSRESRRRCASRASCASRRRPRRRAAARSTGAPSASRSCSATGSRSRAGSRSPAAASRSSSLEARPDAVVRGLTPPGGARSWSDAVARPLPAARCSSG